MQWKHCALGPTATTACSVYQRGSEQMKIKMKMRIKKANRKKIPSTRLTSFCLSECFSPVHFISMFCLFNESTKRIEMEKNIGFVQNKYFCINSIYNVTLPFVCFFSRLFRHTIHNKFVFVDDFVFSPCFLSYFLFYFMGANACLSGSVSLMCGCVRVRLHLPMFSRVITYPIYMVF